jgi:DNA repair and recombination protein RAD52
MALRIGDQHKANGHEASNPFDTDKPSPSAYTAAQIATLQSRLDKQLGPEYISSRPGAAGQKVHYLAAEKVINLANEVFGFNGWSSAIQNIQIDFVDENATTGKISLGLSVIVRVTLKDGTFHEDVGYGHIENCKGKAAAFEKCKKEGTTDGLKRALRTFGNVLGNCIYDKDFVARVTKVKVGTGRWDINELHRHPDFMPKEVKEEVKKIEYEEKVVSNPTSLTVSSNEDFPDGIDMADFDEADFNMSDPLGHPDEVVLPTESASARGAASNAAPYAQMRPPAPGRNGITTPSRPPAQKMTPAPPGATRPYLGPASGPAQARPPMQQHQPVQTHQHHQPDRAHPNTTATLQQPTNSSDNRSSSPGMPSQHFAPQGAPTNEPPGFFSAKAAGANPAVAPRFNPHAESPSIRKTPGIDHRKSAPVKHDLVKQPLPPGVSAPGPKDFVDPRSNTGRQLGTGPGQSPQPNRTATGFSGGGMSTSAYRPPTRRSDGPAVGVPAYGTGNGNTAAGVKRPPLNDVSNMRPQHHVTAQDQEGADMKRQRISGPGPGPGPGHGNLNLDGAALDMENAGRPGGGAGGTG